MSDLSRHLAECVSDQLGEVERGGALYDDEDSRALIDGMIDAGWKRASEMHNGDPVDTLYDAMFNLFGIGFAAGREFQQRGYVYAVEPSQVDLPDVPDSPEGLS